jgi:osmotically inducible lipoprotein OsmB
MKRSASVLVLLAFVFTLGCSGMTRTQQTTLSGGALGAATGAGIAAIAGGNAGVGALIGGAAGALGGYVVGEKTK